MILQGKYAEVFIERNKDKKFFLYFPIFGPHLPRLTGKAPKVARTQPMFWDFFETQAVRMGDWKLWRNVSGDRLFNIAKDPYELANVVNQYPEKGAELAAKLDAWVSTLRPDAIARLKDDSTWGNALSGAPAGIKADPRYLVPYDNPAPKPYPMAMTGRPVPHGHGVLVEKPKERSSEESTEEFHGKPSKLVDGWMAAGACSLFQKEGQLVVKFAGGGSSFHVRKLKPLKGGPFTLKFGMKSNTLGKILIIYNKPSRDTLMPLRLKTGGSFHEYEVEIPVETLEGLRFNPAKAAGTIEVDWIRILDNTGKTVQSWEF